MVPPEYPVELPTTPAESAAVPIMAPTPSSSATVTLRGLKSNGTKTYVSGGDGV